MKLTTYVNGIIRMKDGYIFVIIKIEKIDEKYLYKIGETIPNITKTIKIYY